MSYLIEKDLIDSVIDLNTFYSQAKYKCGINCNK